MFDDEFSPKFESVFRVFFIIWVCFWGVIDIFTLLGNYAAINVGEITTTNLGEWWVNILSTLVGITCGMVLLFIMTTIPSRIAKSKKITKIGLMTTLAVVYYLFPTFADIFASALFDAVNFPIEFARLSAWLLPSIIMLVFHIAYFSDLRAFNRELGSKTKTA